MVPANHDAPVERRSDASAADGNRRYRVFISYSHADTRWANWLLRRLEGYRVPGRFQGRRAPIGRVGARIAPVFRDRDELPTTSDLGETIRAALRQSETLVVICSPAAAESRWVREEIVSFKRLHGERRVFAFIVAGEPKHEGAADDCFPLALRRQMGRDGELGEVPAEVVAADAREQGDGPKLALVRLVAGLLGVGFDDLRQRELQRRNRRLTIIAVASAAGMVLMLGLALSAWRARGEALAARNDAVVARDEARRGREQAEGLIEFMLGDLRRKLDAVGRLDVFKSVGDKALEYYAGQDAAKLEAHALGRRARTLHLIGEVNEQRGQLAEALEAFKRGAETTEQLLRREPQNPQRIFDHAQSVFWVGFGAWRRGHVLPAEQSFREYLELAGRLVRIDGSNLEWQAETCFARNNIGVVYLNTGRMAEALAMFGESRATWERIVPAKPARAFDLANTLGWVAKAHEALGQFDAAIAAHEEKGRALQRIPDAATNKRVQRQDHNIRFELARLELALGRVATALPLARHAEETARALVQADAQNKFWVEQHAFALSLLAEAELAAGQVGAARGTSAALLAACARLTEVDATVASWNVRMHGRALVIAALLAPDAERPELIGRLDAFLQRARETMATDLGVAAPIEGIAAEVELRLGNLLAAQDRRDEARAKWQACVARLQVFAERGDLSALTFTAHARFRLGERDAAQALARRVAVTPFRHPAYVELTHMLSGGAGPSAAQP